MGWLEPDARAFRRRCKGVPSQSNGMRRHAGQRHPGGSRLLLDEFGIAVPGGIQLRVREATRDAVEGDLLDRLARGDVSDPEAVIRRASRLGYDLTQPHLALAL